MKLLIASLVAATALCSPAIAQEWDVLDSYEPYGNTRWFYEDQSSPNNFTCDGVSRNNGMLCVYNVPNSSEVARIADMKLTLDINAGLMLLRVVEMNQNDYNILYTASVDRVVGGVGRIPKARFMIMLGGDIQLDPTYNDDQQAAADTIDEWNDELALLVRELVETR